MTLNRITPILFVMAALAWLAAGMFSTSQGETEIMSYSLAAVFAALSLIYFRNQREKGGDN